MQQYTSTDLTIYELIRTILLNKSVMIDFLSRQKDTKQFKIYYQFTLNAKNINIFAIPGMTTMKCNY